MSCVTSGRPSIRPLSDHAKATGCGGGAVAKVGCEQDEFMCEVCAVDDEDELRAADEEEQAKKANPLPTPFQPTLSQYLNIASPITRTSRDAPIASKHTVVSLGTTPM